MRQVTEVTICFWRKFSAFLQIPRSFRQSSVPSSSSLCSCTSVPDCSCQIYHQNEEVLLLSPVPRKGRYQWSPSEKTPAEAWLGPRSAYATHCRSQDFQWRVG